MTRPRLGFSLLEVLLAVTIAAAGVCWIYQGILVATNLQKRQRFYEGCTAFLDNQLEQLVATLDTSGGPLEGVAEDSGGAVRYSLTWDSPDELKELTRITVKLGPVGNPPGLKELTLVTYQSRLLRPRDGRAR